MLRVGVRGSASASSCARMTRGDAAASARAAPPRRGRLGTVSRLRPWRATMRLSSASASIWSTITRRICAVLSAVSSGSSSTPRRSSCARDFEFALHLGRHLLHGLHHLGEAVGGLLQQLVRLGRVLLEQALAVVRHLLIEVAQRIEGALLCSSVAERMGACCSAIERAPSEVASATSAGDVAGAVLGDAQESSSSPRSA